MNICTWLYTERNGKKRCFGAVVFPFFSVHERSQGEPACGRIFYDPAVKQIANVRFIGRSSAGSLSGVQKMLSQILSDMRKQQPEAAETKEKETNLCVYIPLT